MSIARLVITAVVVEGRAAEVARHELCHGEPRGHSQGVGVVRAEPVAPRRVHIPSEVQASVDFAPYQKVTHRSSAETTGEDESETSQPQACLDHAIGPTQQTHATHQRRLSGPVATAERDHLTDADPEADVLQHRGLAVTGREVVSPEHGQGRRCWQEGVTAVPALAGDAGG